MRVRVNIRKLLRRPVKKILCGLLFLVITMFVLLFSLQYWIDGISLSEAESYYSYAGTIYNPSGSHPDFDPISGEALEILADSENLAELDVRNTYSCRVQGLMRTSDWFLEDIPYDLAHWYMVEGTVLETPQMQAYGQYNIESFKLQVDRYWAGAQQRFDVLNIDVYYEAEDRMRHIWEGERCFLVGHYRCPGGRGAANYVSVYQAPYSELVPGIDWGDDSPLLSGGLTELPQDLTEEERETYIRDYLEEKKLTVIGEAIDSVEGVYTLYTVGNMSLLFPVKEETMFFSSGRELTPEDTGRPVCVISDELAEKNGLQPGDMLTLSVSEHNYVVGQHSFYAGRESGLPCESDAILDDYINCGEFEIVGTYAFLNRDNVLGSYAFSYNDIFVPKGVLPWENADRTDTVRPYRMSFRISGTRYTDFLDECEAALANQGYYLRMSVSRWDEVSDSFYAIQGRRRWMLAGTIVAFLAGISAFDCLLLVQNRKEYALRRLLGAYAKEARGVFYSAFALCGLPAAMLSVLAGGLAYRYWMAPRMAELALGNAIMPSAGQCVGVMVCLAAAELAVAFGMLYLLARWLERRPLLKLLK